MDPELADTLRARSSLPAQRRAVILPDMFVDHLIPVAHMTWLRGELERVLTQGGGNAIAPGQQVKLGGNAANTAFALGRLGVPTTLVTQTDAVGRTLWDEARRGLPLDSTCIQKSPRASMTLALELQEESANLMLSDPGPLTDFGPDALTEQAWDLIAQADVVAIMNWAQTLEHGTRLLTDVVDHAKKHGTFTFLDTGDPAHRGDDAHRLLQQTHIFQGLDAWGLNEHETRWYAGALLGEDPQNLDVETAAHALKRHTAGRVDVHMHDAALSLEPISPTVTTGMPRITRVAAFDVTPRHRTGAGDAWNAGNLTGTLLGLPPAQRLRLANATAALTLTGTPPGPPTYDEVIAFLSDR